MAHLPSRPKYATDDMVSFAAFCAAAVDLPCLHDRWTLFRVKCCNNMTEAQLN